MTYNKKSLKELYPNEKEINKAISNCQRDIWGREQYNTRESKLAVQRLKEFLKILEEVKQELEGEK